MFTTPKTLRDLTISASILLLTWGNLIGLISIASSATQTPHSVFYPEFISEDCQKALPLLQTGKYPLASDKGAVETIGLPPQWTSQEKRSDFFIFMLQGLGFLACPIQAGEQGNTQALEAAKNTILDWDKNHPFKGSPQNWNWDQNVGAWEEHALSWRSIILSYFYKVYKQSPNPDPTVIKRLQEMAKTHGAILSLNRIYMPDHNHGLNNSMALIALGMAFTDLPNAQQWLNLGQKRVEQQMRDNVSTDGIHLEQSGEYHTYTLRSFMAIYQAFESIGQPLSSDYRKKLDQMLGASALMVGRNGKIEGLPYSEANKNVIQSFLSNFEQLNLGSVASGQQFLRQVSQGKTNRGLYIYPQGGYSFFVPGSDQELEVIFKTRILDAPHAQQNAMSVAARLGNQDLIIYPSGNIPPNWEQSYFSTPLGQNTVQVNNLEQKPLHPPVQAGLAGIWNWGKLQGVMDKLGLKDWLLGQRRDLKVDDLTLNQRLFPENGQVLAFGSSPQLDFVSAKHKTYPKITHTRTVARIGSRYLLVWDRLEGENLQEYTQTFHFPTNAQVELTSSNGVVQVEGKPIAHFKQMASGVEGSVCRGELKPEKCGWYGDTKVKLIPTSAVRYRGKQKQIEFLWVLSATPGEFDAKLNIQGTGKSSRRVLTLNGEDGQFQLLLQAPIVRLE
jgi:Uncharacterized protein conserved in bacteria